MLTLNELLMPLPSSSPVDNLTTSFITHTHTHAHVYLFIIIYDKKKEWRHSIL